MLKPRLVVPNVSAQVSSHEDLFVDRYRLLLSWALGLTNGQRAGAEDLLHDLLIQFTINQPDLDRIENLEGYLRTMLRNLHLSRLRRASVALSSEPLFPLPLGEGQGEGAQRRRKERIKSEPLFSLNPHPTSPKGRGVFQSSFVVSSKMKNGK